MEASCAVFAATEKTVRSVVSLSMMSCLIRFFSLNLMGVTFFVGVSVERYYNFRLHLSSVNLNRL